MKQAPVFIFDFDGTLADSAPIIRAIYAEIASKNGLKVMTDEDYNQLRHGTLGDARKWAGVRWWQYPLLVRNIQKLMKLEAEKVKLFPGAAELVRELHGNGLQLYILSRNRSAIIHAVLERHNLAKELVVLSRHKRTLGSKTAVLERLVRINKYDKQSVWMIGDEVRDIQAAKRAGVNSIAVTWGLQDASILEQYEPTHVVSSVEELHDVLNAVA